MTEPNGHDVVELSTRRESLIHSAGGTHAPHLKPLRLTISLEKIDLFLADLQKQVEDLQRRMTNLKLARIQLACYWRENGSDEEQTPHIDSALVGMHPDS